MKRVVSVAGLLCALGLALVLSLAPVSAAESAAQTGRPAAWATPVDPAFNLYRITPTLYRSRQIEAQDIAELKQLGIRNVVSLRAFHSDRDVLKGSGIAHTRIKVLTWNIGDDDVVKALRAIRRAEKEGPVLLHCQHGADRTGLVSAMYRMVFQGWTREQALEELQSGDFGYHTLWKNIPDYLRSVDVESIRRRVMAD